MEGIEIDGGLERLGRLLGCLESGHVQPTSGGCQGEHAVARANVDNQRLWRAFTRCCSGVDVGASHPHAVHPSGSHGKLFRLCMHAEHTLQMTWQVGKEVFYYSWRPAQQIVGLPNSVLCDLVGDVYTLRIWRGHFCVLNFTIFLLFLSPRRWREGEGSAQ